VGRSPSPVAGPTLKLDVRLTDSVVDTAAAARRYEQVGYAAAWVAETKHDPFIQAYAALDATTQIKVGTSIAVAFARTPMTVAMSANHLQYASSGRFILGLGTQVRAHIERRYSMPWSAPAARMREFVEALRAIWQAWNEDSPLSFDGRFYRHDLMTPFFRPDPNPYGTPPVLLAGVGPKMTETAGAVADGFICHAFTTQRYLREVTVPTLTAARRSAGRDSAPFDVCGAFFVVTGADEAEVASMARSTKQQIAFYASTPAYRPVLDLHGWREAQTELNALVRADRWDDMAAVITDEMLDAFAVVAEPGNVADVIRARYGDLVTRCVLYFTKQSSAQVVDAITQDLAQA
jgi:probable F420-dependent oxidoreductase